MRYALAIFIFISLCTLLSFVTLCFLSEHSIQIGAPHDRIGSFAPAYIIRRTFCLSPHLILADFERAWIIFIHFPVIFSICSLKVNRLSIVMPKYFIVSFCSFLLFRKILKSLLFFGFSLLLPLFFISGL